MRTICALLALTTLAACGKPDNAPGPGGVTVGEAKALDEAAEMVEKRRMPDAALRPSQATSAAASGAP